MLKICKLTYYSNAIRFVLMDFDDGYYTIKDVEREIRHLMEFSKDDEDITPQEHTLLHCFGKMVDILVKKENLK